MTNQESSVTSLRSRLEEVEGALDAAGLGTWDMRIADGTITRSVRNDEIFGADSGTAAWTTQMLLERLHAEDRSYAQQALNQATTTGCIDIEVRYARSGETALRWLHMSGRTFYEDNVAVRMSGVFADITERRAAEDRLRQAQKIEALGRLTGGVAHDFNNLLQVISGGLQIMARQTDPVRRERTLTAMKLAVDRGATLCRQLLTFSRRQAMRPEPVDLQTLLGSMHELLKRSVRADVQIRTEFGPALWPVEVDSSELELVVLNLAVNAHDAMPGGGTLHIEVQNRDAVSDPELCGDYVCLRVADTGMGMAPEVIAHAFEPFFTTKEIGRGSGLGLAQAHGFARASGGSIRIESVVGRGTTVTLWLPRTRKVPQTSHAATAQSERSAGEEGQVLLVEDDDEVAALAVEMINQLGYDTTRVASAEAALGALAARPPVDIVFSDVMMPGCMNGVELAQEIRRRHPDVPVLLTSGFADVASRSAAAHRIKIIPKPYRMDDLKVAFASARQDARSSIRDN